MAILRNSIRSRLKRITPWLMLALALSVFYDFTVFTHLPLPDSEYENWAELTKPRILKTTILDNSSLIQIETERGPVWMYYYPAKSAELGLVTVGGIGANNNNNNNNNSESASGKDTLSAQGFDSPAAHVYERLGKELVNENISTVHLRFRSINPFEDTVHDVRAAVEFLHKLGIKKVVVIGHSLGGASVISAASYEPGVIGVAALCSQPYGADRVRTLNEKRLYIAAGLFDVVEPPCWSSAIYREAHCQKQLTYFRDFHNLETCANDVYKSLHQWIVECKGADKAKRRVQAALHPCQEPPVNWFTAQNAAENRGLF